MQILSRLLPYNPLKSALAATNLRSTFRLFSSGNDFWNDVDISWSTGLTKEHFDGEVVGRPIDPEQQTESQSQPKAGPTTASQFANARFTEREIDMMKELEAENKKGKAFVDGWGERLREMSVLLKQVREPGARGSYLKDSEKAEMYKLHKENPEVYTVEKLAKDYRIMRQRVHAILWLKELEEEEEKKLGHPLDDSVELLLDTCPDNSSLRCGLESAIKNLHNLHLGYVEGNTGSAVKLSPDSVTGVTTADEILMKDDLARDTVQLEGAEWVELLVREMQSATSTDDARSRATRVLESLEKSISARASAEAAQSVHEENIMLKEQTEVLVRENTILKRAVAIQHERQKEYDERNQEVQHMKQMIAQYQEHLKNLEFNNYALTMHLKQSLERNVMPGSSNRDVF